MASNLPDIRVSQVRRHRSTAVYVYILVAKVLNGLGACKIPGRLSGNYGYVVNHF
jgi:hypothetical protein